MHSADADGMANSVDPNQTARSSLIWVCTVWSDLFVQVLRVFTVKQYLCETYIDKIAMSI